MKENLGWFEKYRKEQSDCVKTYQELPRVVIKAPIKSGKRELCEIEALRTKVPGSKGFQHYFLCSLNRKDNKVQYEEMKAYGIECYTYLDYEKFLAEIDLGLDSNQHKFYIFIDESDLGTEDKQKLAKVFDHLVEISRKIEERIFLRFYSATQQEIEYSNYINFCEYFLDNKLVQEAEPFFIFNKDKEVALSHQAIEILEGFSKSKDKIFSVLRITTGMGKKYPDFAKVMNDHKIQKYLGEKYKIILKKVDEKHSMGWGDTNSLNDGQFIWKDQYQRSLSAFDGKGGKTIFVINQTCTRSTEVGFIPLIYFWHECRGNKTPFNTIIQSSMRCCHYPYKKMVREISEGKERYYWGDDPDTKVKIYTNVDCVELYAEKIDLVEYQKRQPKRPLSTRVSSGVGFFMPTSEMIEKRRIEVLEIPEDILSAAFGSPSVKNHKNKYPIINDWASNQEAVKAHYERYQEVVSDKSNFFIRPVSANYTNNIAKSLLNKSSHCILAPILFDSPNPCWVSDYHDILKKHPDLEKKLILVHISDMEYNERIEQKEKYSPKVKRSLYNREEKSSKVEKSVSKAKASGLGAIHGPIRSKYPAQEKTMNRADMLVSRVFGLISANPSLNRREIHNRCGNNLKAGELDTTLQTLITQGRIYLKKVSTRGRPAERFWPVSMGNDPVN